MLFGELILCLDSSTAKNKNPKTNTKTKTMKVQMSLQDLKFTFTTLIQHSTGNAFRAN